MPATWPATLPQDLRVEGFRQGLGERRRFSATDTGPGKVFGRTSAVADPLDGTMLMTAAQLADFEAFLLGTLDRAALPFTFPDPRSGSGTLLVRIRTDSMPEWAAIHGGLFRVSLPLEVLP